ncbi:MAG: hypothetical protein AAFP10_07695 [Pseudomonadota bacterium]
MLFRCRFWLILVGSVALIWAEAELGYCLVHLGLDHSAVTSADNYFWRYLGMLVLITVVNACWFYTVACWVLGRPTPRILRSVKRMCDRWYAASIRSVSHHATGKFIA